MCIKFPIGYYVLQDGLNKDFNLCLSVSGGNKTLTGIYDVSAGDPEELDELYFDTGKRRCHVIKAI